MKDFIPAPFLWEKAPAGPASPLTPPQYWQVSMNLDPGFYWNDEQYQKQTKCSSSQQPVGLISVNKANLSIKLHFYITSPFLKRGIEGDFIRLYLNTAFFNV